MNSKNAIKQLKEGRISPQDAARSLVEYGFVPVQYSGDDRFQPNPAAHQYMHPSMMHQAQFAPRMQMPSARPRPRTRNWGKALAVGAGVAGAVGLGMALAGGGKPSEAKASPSASPAPALNPAPNSGSTTTTEKQVDDPVRAGIVKHLSSTSTTGKKTEELAEHRKTVGSEEFLNDLKKHPDADAEIDAKTNKKKTSKLLPLTKPEGNGNPSLQESIGKLINYYTGKEEPPKKGETAKYDPTNPEHHAKPESINKGFNFLQENLRIENPNEKHANDLTQRREAYQRLLEHKDKIDPKDLEQIENFIDTMHKANDQVNRGDINSVAELRRTATKNFFDLSPSALKWALRTGILGDKHTINRQAAAHVLERVKEGTPQNLSKAESASLSNYKNGNEPEVHRLHVKPDEKNPDRETVHGYIPKRLENRVTGSKDLYRTNPLAADELENKPADKNIDKLTRRLSWLENGWHGEMSDEHKEEIKSIKAAIASEKELLNKTQPTSDQNKAVAGGVARSIDSTNAPEGKTEPAAETSPGLPDAAAKAANAAAQPPDPPGEQRAAGQTVQNPETTGSSGAAERPIRDSQFKNHRQIFADYFSNDPKAKSKASPLVDSMPAAISKALKSDKQAQERVDAYLASQPPIKRQKLNNSIGDIHNNRLSLKRKVDSATSLPPEMFDAIFGTTPEAAAPPADSSVSAPKEPATSGARTRDPGLVDILTQQVNAPDARGSSAPEIDPNMRADANAVDPVRGGGTRPPAPSAADIAGKAIQATTPPVIPINKDTKTVNDNKPKQTKHFNELLRIITSKDPKDRETAENTTKRIAQTLDMRYPTDKARADRRAEVEQQAKGLSTQDQIVIDDIRHLFMKGESEPSTKLLDLYKKLSREGKKVVRSMLEQEEAPIQQSVSNCLNAIMEGFNPNGVVLALFRDLYA